MDRIWSTIEEDKTEELVLRHRSSGALAPKCAVLQKPISSKPHTLMRIRWRRGTKMMVKVYMLGDGVEVSEV